MKFILPLIFLFTTMIGFSQITQGRIVYSMQLYDEQNEAGGAVQTLENSEMILHFSKQNTHNSVKMGPDMEISTILNQDNQKGLLVIKGLMGDITITASYAELTAEEGEIEVEVEQFEQTKEILGHQCKKSKVFYSNGAFGTFWCTEDIQFCKKGIENMHVNLPGTPLEYTIESDGSIMTFKAQSVDKMEESKASSLFSPIPPEGFKVITYKEFEENGF